MQLTLATGFMLAFAPVEDLQNTPPKNDTEPMCVPNRTPQSGTRRPGTRKPTVQCNLASAEREGNRDRLLRNLDRDPMPTRAAFEPRAGVEQ